MTRRWNETVARGDVVYYLGDFAMKNPQDGPTFCARLNGRKFLVRGNHDKGPEFMLGVGFEAVHENLVAEIDGVRVWMNHYPIDDGLISAGTVGRRPLRRMTSLCGHVHEKWKIRAGCVNVGVDVWDFTPISLTQISGALRDAS